MKEKSTGTRDNSTVEAVQICEIYYSKWRELPSIFNSFCTQRTWENTSDDFTFLIKLVGLDWENRDYRHSRPLDDRKRLMNASLNLINRSVVTRNGFSVEKYL